MLHQAKLPMKEALKLSGTSLTRNADPLTHTATIFLHGFLGSRKTFTPSARYLQVQLQLPCYVPDLRNHGSTKPWVCNMDYTSQANDLREYINEHGFGKVNLVGYSMGAKIIMDYIFRDLHKRDSVEVGKLVLMDNAPVTNDIGTEFRSYANLLREANQFVTYTKLNPRTWKETVAAKLKNHSLPKHLVLYFLDLFERQGHHIKMKIPPHILEEEILKELGRFPQFNDASTDIETLFIKATQSEFISTKGLKAIDDTFSNYKVLEYDAEHQGLLAHYGAAITEELAKFLKE